MEAVRAWILKHLELLASVDLPAETFMPQVAVQASCVFLRRRHPDELLLAEPRGPKQRPVFMAIAENIGHGRRGETRYVRNADGSELLAVRDLVERWEVQGKIREKLRKKEMRVIADDLPWIAGQYRRHVTGGALEERV